MLLSDQEVRIRWLERNLDHIARQTSNLLDEIGQTNQIIQLSQNSPTVGGMSTATGTITGTIGGCAGQTITGATVNALASGVVVATTTSGAGGTFSFTAPTSTDHVQIIDSPRFATHLTTCTVTSGMTTALGGISLSPASGYVCTTITGCAFPLATTLHLTDPNATITLTYDPTFGWWWGCYTRVGVSGEILPSCSASPVTTTVVYVLSANGLGLSAWFPTCQFPGPTHKPTQAATCPANGNPPFSTSSGLIAATSQSFVCPPTFSHTSTMNLVGGGTTLVSGSVTITE